MLMRSTILLLACSLLVATPAPLSAEGPTVASIEDWNGYRDEQHGFAFQYPSQFVVGAYKRETPPVLERALVLVEAELLGPAESTEIPVGEVATISIEAKTGGDARFVLQQVPKLVQPTERMFGSHRVLVYPGYPGPYGDQACYYVVPLGADTVLEIIGHRKRFSSLAGIAHDEATDTGYDQVIEQIILTIERLGTDGS